MNKLLYNGEIYIKADSSDTKLEKISYNGEIYIKADSSDMERQKEAIKHINNALDFAREASSIFAKSEDSLDKLKTTYIHSVLEKNNNWSKIIETSNNVFKNIRIYENALKYLLDNCKDKLRA